MSRLDLLLLIALLASALFLVHTSYEARDLYTQLEKQNAQEHDLHAELEQLEVERRVQATPLRVEKLARERLSMGNASPAITQYVSTRLPAALSPVSPGDASIDRQAAPGASGSAQP